VHNVVQLMCMSLCPYSSPFTTSFPNCRKHHVFESIRTHDMPHTLIKQNKISQEAPTCRSVWTLFLLYDKHKLRSVRFIASMFHNSIVFHKTHNDSDLAAPQRQ